jgi:hypothetical protein
MSVHNARNEVRLHKQRLRAGHLELDIGETIGRGAGFVGRHAIASTAVAVGGLLLAKRTGLRRAAIALAPLAARPSTWGVAVRFADGLVRGRPARRDAGRPSIDPAVTDPLVQRAVYRNGDA